MIETIETDETQDKKSEPPTKKQKSDQSQKLQTKISPKQTTKDKTPSSIYSDERDSQQEKEKAKKDTAMRDETEPDKKLIEATNKNQKLLTSEISDKPTSSPQRNITS